MARTWSADNPKAALMARKRAVIVGAALEAFLRLGYAEASVNQIAAAAGVSIKTLYRHFESKDELFSAVMQAACGRSGKADSPAEEAAEPLPAWYDLPPDAAFPQAGEAYLSHALSVEQLALYRGVTRDAHRFPELGRRYQQEVVGRRDAVFGGYLERWAAPRGWTVRDPRRAAQAFAGLLKAGLFDEALQGSGTPSPATIAERAGQAARDMLLLLEAGRF